MNTDLASIDDAGSHDRVFQFSLRRLFRWIFWLCVVMAVLAAGARGVRLARRSAISMNSEARLNQLAFALQNYHVDNGCFPPAFIADANGTPMHSWRVLILPYMEQQALYKAYDFSEPWNGPNNSKLANQMPVLFWTPSENASTTYTNIVVITGPGTAFPGSRSTRYADFTDGTANTILLTEIANSTVPWLQPVDIEIEKCTRLVNDPDALSISAAPWRRPYVVFADGIVTYPVSENMPCDVLRALTTIAGREPIERQRLIDLGFLTP